MQARSDRETGGVEKHFGAVRALDGVDFAVEVGESSLLSDITARGNRR